MSGDEVQRRRSRLAWPTRTEPTTTPAGTHDHAQSNGPLLLAFVCILLLFLVNVGLVWFIIARGQSRDAAEQQMRQEIRDSWCEALDGLPAENFFLDGLRGQYKCGPGLPVEDLPPEIQQKLNGAPAVPAPPPAPANVAPGEPLPGGGVAPPGVDPENIPPPAPQREPIPAPQSPAEPPAEPGPVVDLQPLTHPLCEALSLCL